MDLSFLLDCIFRFGQLMPYPTSDHAAQLINQLADRLPAFSLDICRIPIGTTVCELEIAHFIGQIQLHSQLLMSYI